MDPDKLESKNRLSPKEVGCEFCPLDKVPGIHKVKGEVHGREIFIWGMAPGREENEELREFVGKSGKLLWQELERVGILRSMSDVQNIVRCFPVRWPALKMRDPPVFLGGYDDPGVTVLPTNQYRFVLDCVEERTEALPGSGNRNSLHISI